jgi:hypothetical protein
LQDAEAMREEEVVACAFDQWYEKFKDISLRSCIIPLSEDFVKYLQADGISVPTTVSIGICGRGDDGGSEWGDGGSDSEGSCQGQGDVRQQVQNFPELERRVEEAIASLGGSVLPKLNWSAPKDARWILGGLKCESVHDVFTLLKASDFVAHDLCHSFDHCRGDRARPDQFSLVLRRWYDLDEAGEFRCFAYNKRLLAVSQRHTTAHFPCLSELEFKSVVLTQITACFEKHIKDAFPLERFAFDVFVGRPPRRKVSLIDFSPWGASTDPLLFEWDELRLLANTGCNNPEEHLPEFRVVATEGEVRTRLENYHSLPLEVAQLGACSNEEVEDLCRRAGLPTQQR